MILDTRYSETRIIPSTDTADVMLEVVRYREAFPASMCSMPMLSRPLLFVGSRHLSLPSQSSSTARVVLLSTWHPGQQPHISMRSAERQVSSSGSNQGKISPAAKGESERERERGRESRRGRERKREEREGERERERERQTDRQTDRQTESETEPDIDRETERERKSLSSVSRVCPSSPVPHKWRNSKR